MLLVSILIPLLGAGLLFLLRPQNAKLRGLLVMVTALITSACVAWCLFTPGDHAVVLLRLSTMLTVSLRLDGLGCVFAGLVAFLWPLASLYGLEYMRHEGGENHFFGFYLISYAVTLGIAFSEDLMSLYVFYELLSLATLPLVMHGGSGVSDEDYRIAIRNGIRKVNYYSYMSKAGVNAVKAMLAEGDVTFYHDLALAAQKAMEADVEKAMRVFAGL